MAFFDKHDGGEYNHMRLGGTSRVADAAFTGANVPGAYRGNYTGDHTIDEFYAWNNNSADPTKLWGLGRYYKPTGGGGGGTGGAAKEGRFTSGALTDMVPYSPRVLAPPSSVAPPGGGGGVTGGSMTVEPPSLRILGMSWTWYGEALDPAFTDPAAWDGTPILYDYSGANWGGVPKSTLDIKVGAGIQDGTTDYGPFWDAAYSPILDTNGVTPIIYDPKQVKYFVQFDLKSQLQTILLGTPVIDDVTLFWDDNQSHMLSYVFDNRSF
jgi:hypothetical protein